jgi:hypothetical protein
MNYSIDSGIKQNTAEKTIFTKNAYFPCAVSPESMTASAPSRTAMAISETSARVGVGWLIMLSNIFVATITGFPMLQHTLIISSYKSK